MAKTKTTKAEVKPIKSTAKAKTAKPPTPKSQQKTPVQNPVVMVSSPAKVGLKKDFYLKAFEIYLNNNATAFGLGPQNSSSDWKKHADDLAEVIKEFVDAAKL